MAWFDKLRRKPTAPTSSGGSPAPPPATPGAGAPVAAEAPSSASPQSAAATKFLRRVDNLQAIPGVASRLLQTLDDPNASADAIAQDVRRDQALMAIVLRMANSAYYRSSGQVRDITESIVVLGYDTTRQLVLGRLSRQVLRKNDAWQKQLWRHALATALGAQACARRVRGVTVAHAFTAGLLHDIGKAVMHEAFPEEVARLWSTLAADPRPSDEAERASFGTDHAEVGAELLRDWQFPEMYRHAARLHASGGESLGNPKDRRLLSIVALSGAVASSLGHDAVPNRKGPVPLDHPAIAELGAAPPVLQAMETEIEGELAALVEIFG